MNVTTEFLANSFKVFNTLYFNNELVTPIFEVSHTKSALGDFRSIGYRYFRIRISDYYVREKRDIEQTLLHEMIHLYQRQMLNESGHGWSFKQKAEEINRKGGYSISRTTSVQNCQISNPKPKRKKTAEYNVAVYHSHKGKWFEFVVASNKVNDWVNTLQTHSEIASYFMFKSKAEKYSNYPSCRKICKGHYISEEEAINLQQEYGCKVYERWTTRRKAL